MLALRCVLLLRPEDVLDVFSQTPHHPNAVRDKQNIFASTFVGNLTTRGAEGRGYSIGPVKSAASVHAAQLTGEYRPAWLLWCPGAMGP